jgi:hypothetical protein
VDGSPAPASTSSRRRRQADPGGTKRASARLRMLQKPKENAKNAGGGN